MIRFYDYSIKTDRKLPGMHMEPALELEEPRICPLCKVASIPELIAGIMIDPHPKTSKNYDVIFSKILYFCTSCDDVFIAKYNVEVKLITDYYLDGPIYPTELIETYPKNYKKTFFSEGILEISPMFVEIFNQAEYAESLEITHGSGMIYRRALEFLIKDYAIRSNIDKEDAIKKNNLSKCIKDYIPDPRIQNLARASAYLGNDHSHYHVRHTGRDLDDFKRLINALVHYIEMELILEDSENIK